MNERIQELAHEAGLPTYNPEGIPTKLEKFARLIVRECIDIAGKEDFDVMMKEGYPCSQTAKKIREHFGVEE
jgi:hypothetical protein